MNSVANPPLNDVNSFQDKKKKYEPPIPTRVGKRKKKTKGPDAASKLPLGTHFYFIHTPSIFISKYTDTYFT